MKECKLVIEINCSASEIFEFTLNPANTPLWIDNILHEEKNQSPTKIGTVYRNINKEGKWTEYEIVGFDPNKMFELKQKGGFYHVLYKLEALSADSTKLTYFEWVEEGELDEPFSIIILEKLKRVLERQ